MSPYEFLDTLYQRYLERKPKMLKQFARKVMEGNERALLMILRGLNLAYIVPMDYGNVNADGFLRELTKKLNEPEENSRYDEDGRPLFMVEVCYFIHLPRATRDQCSEAEGTLISTVRQAQAGEITPNHLLLVRNKLNVMLRELHENKRIKELLIVPTRIIEKPYSSASEITSELVSWALDHSDKYECLYNLLVQAMAETGVLKSAEGCNLFIPDAQSDLEWLRYGDDDDDYRDDYGDGYESW
ncbi:MAG: hypothetical protein ACOCXQ_03530 [Patescibacteria group bacterium]